MRRTLTCCTMLFALLVIAGLGACGPTGGPAWIVTDAGQRHDGSVTPPTGDDCQPGDPDVTGCPCVGPGAVQACWPELAPQGLRGIGGCQDGSQICVATDDAAPLWGPCTGADLPSDDVSTDGEDQDCDGDDNDDMCTAESCTDSADNDCDGQVDCGDIDCDAAAECNTCPGTSENCTDGIDNDCDGQIDCFDTNCWFNPSCLPDCLFELCTNGTDDDCDGLADCLDPQCASTPECGCHCIPGTTRWCDTTTACTWGLQDCLPDGAWGTCVEVVPPAPCTSGLYSTDCCLGYPDACCQDYHDSDSDGDTWESVGECTGITDCS